MISQITVFIEHGDTTDPLDEFLDASGISENFRAEGVIDYSVIVDVPSPVKEDDGIICLLCRYLGLNHDGDHLVP